MNTLKTSTKRENTVNYYAEFTELKNVISELKYTREVK